MNEKENYLNQISEIRNLMSESARFISLSGLSGVFAGFCGIAGGAVAYWALGFHWYTPVGTSNFQLVEQKTGLSYMPFFLGLAAVVLLVAIGGALFFTIRHSRRKNIPLWGNSSKRLVLNLLIPLGVGGIFGSALLYHGETYLLGSVTLIFYGIALFNAGKYTLGDIRYLGLLEILLGLLSSFFVGYGLLFWVSGFGLLHIVYGILMYFKYERNDTNQ